MMMMMMMMVDDGHTLHQIRTSWKQDHASTVADKHDSYAGSNAGRGDGEVRQLCSNVVNADSSNIQNLQH